MKKTYMKPAALTVEVKSESLMQQVSINQLEGVDTNDSSSDMGTKALMWDTWVAPDED